MALPMAPNTTFDLYHDPTRPPSAPNIAGASGYLKADFRGGQEAGDQQPAAVGETTFTHVLLVSPTLDIRDAYVGRNQQIGNGDVIFVPTKNDTEFYVVFVELIGAGTANNCKRVYLDRKVPLWPTNHL